MLDLLKIEDLFSVRGLSVLITGAASGVGLGYARVLASNGAHVTLVDLDAASLEFRQKIVLEGDQVFLTH